MRSEGIPPSIFKGATPMTETGRFETTTKTKIRTPNGTILKIVTYDGEFPPYIDYNIRPICEYCNKPAGCVCFNVDNSIKPYEDAVSVLKGLWICGNVDCILKHYKEDDPDYYSCIESNFNGDKKEMANMFFSLMPELEEGEFCPC